jgi:DNA-binding NtrC family response regulator
MPHSSLSSESRLLRDYLGNPFAAAAPLATAHAALVLRELDLPALVAAALRRGGARATELVLAAAHAQAHTGVEADALLDDSLLPRSLARRLPRPRADYVRIAAAAGRCARVLTTIRGTSPAIQRARRDAWAACFGDSLHHALELERVIHDHDVLILGETGTGKELFARAMQLATPGQDSGPAPSSAINAAAIPETLVESELFGHAKGAFTGATESRVGRLRSADGGSFFLDEVGDLPSPTQTKLLRVIETNDVYPVGSDTAYTVAIRYIAATHKDLEGMVNRGEFRRDLFERLAGMILRVPPLRERPEDIVEIGRHIVASYLPPADSERRAAVEGWLRSREARRHSWPGNVRELQNALRNLLLGLDPGLRRDPDQPGVGAPRWGAPPGFPRTHQNQDVGRSFAGGAPPGFPRTHQNQDVGRSFAGGAPPGFPRTHQNQDVGRSFAGGAPEPVRRLEATLRQVEDWYRAAVVERLGGNLSRAARVLGVDRSTLRRASQRERTSG